MGNGVNKSFRASYIQICLGNAKEERKWYHKPNQNPHASSEDQRLLSLIIQAVTIVIVPQNHS